MEPEVILPFSQGRATGLPCARLIQSTPSKPTFLNFILMLFSHLRLGLQSGLFP
jgi:hypothetical protein